MKQMRSLRRRSLVAWLASGAIPLIARAQDQAQLPGWYLEAEPFRRSKSRIFLRRELQPMEVVALQEAFPSLLILVDNQRGNLLDRYPERFTPRGAQQLTRPPLMPRFDIRFASTAYRDLHFPTATLLYAFVEFGPTFDKVVHANHYYMRRSQHRSRFGEIWQFDGHTPPDDVPPADAEPARR